jgi:hypothetical protein
MDFLNVLINYIDIDKYYKYLSSFNDAELKNLYHLINIKWCKILNNIDKNKYSHKKLEKYSNFNKNIRKFVNNDIVIGLFVKNIIDRY